MYVIVHITEAQNYLTEMPSDADVVKVREYTVRKTRKLIIIRRKIIVLMHRLNTEKNGAALEINPLGKTRTDKQTIACAV